MGERKGYVLTDGCGGIVVPMNGLPVEEAGSWKLYVDYESNDLMIVMPNGDKFRLKANKES